MTFTASITRRDRKRRLRSGTSVIQTRWIVNFREPRSGRRKQLFFERQKDAIAKRDALLSSAVSGIYSDSKTRFTVADALKHWLEHRHADVKPVTLIGYRHSARYIVGPLMIGTARERKAYTEAADKPGGAQFSQMLGPSRIADLTTGDIRHWHKTLTSLVSSHTANRAKAVLRSALALAAEDAIWPPCDVYKNPAFKIVPVTEVAYGKRLDQLATFVASKVQADVIAFQEVSGEQAVKDLLPSGGADYYVCSFSSHKVQRLAFAWKKELGPASECTVEPAISLPGLDPKDQVRPGLSLALNIDGATFRLLSVHLKSSCVSPLEPRGDLAGNEPACATLQQQVVPLERWIEQKAADTGRFVILGDFNRSLWHEKNSSGAVRTDSSDPSGPLPSTAKVRNLFKEINDGKPTTSTVTLLTETCPLNAVSQTACVKAENPASVDEWKSVTKTLAQVDNLGCRNPVGFDHILIGPGLSSTDQAQKVALGKQGRTLSANATHPDPLLALSDHCPLTATVRY